MKNNNNVTEMHTEVEGELKLKPCKCGCKKVWYGKTKKDQHWVVICDGCGLVYDAECQTQEAICNLWNESVKPTFKEVRILSGMNMTQFAEYFNIPFRTIQNWERGERKCPEYLIELMKYKLNNEKIKGKS